MQQRVHRSNRNRQLRTFLRERSPWDAVIATLDSDSAEAFRRMCATVMLATRFSSATSRRKGESITALYLDALAGASCSDVRELIWRNFITVAASLNKDLEVGQPIATEANRRARDELARIVDENADLLEDGVPV